MMKKYSVIALLTMMLGMSSQFVSAREPIQNLMKMPAVTQAYMKAMNDMHEPMMEGVMDKNPDAAFVKGMIPHHEGAVEMAKIQLKYGTDPELRQLAQDIISSQEKEIKFMQMWLDKYQANK